MPAKNSRKQYLEKGYYHIYNRGVEKRPIFLDEQDYNVFLSYLKSYLLPKDIDKLQEKLANPEISYLERNNVLKELRLNNFSDEILLIAYCLMSNHFHFLIKQQNLNSIDLFMNSLGTRYTMYFNKKYKRVGTLYQGVYKAVLVNSDEQLLHLTRYIHHQAIFNNEYEQQPSSYLEYLGQRKTDWVHPEEILTHFSKTNPELSYETFVKGSESFSNISNIILEK